jgi:DNA invertase Pin-like site-specific DNA recombinase
MGGIFGYVRASTDPTIDDAEAQKRVIAEYAKRHGCTVDGFYSDPAVPEKKDLIDRPAGRELLIRLKRGDRVIVARLDRLANSFIGFAHLLKAWDNRGIILHLCDLPAGSDTLDPSNPLSRRLVHLLCAFADRERQMLGERTRESFAQLKAEGRRRSRFAPFGFRWERRGGKTYMVPNPEEQELCCRVARWYAEGKTIDQIRQYLSYVYKIRNRNGNDFGRTELRGMVDRGAELLGLPRPSLSYNGH